MHAEVPMDRLSAVVPGAHGHARGVEDLSDIVRVHAVDGEGHDAEPLGRVGRAEDAQSVDAGEPAEHLLREHPLPRVETVHAQVRQVLDGCAPARRLRQRLAAGLEPGGTGHVGR